MTEFLLQLGLSNLLVALVIAVVAWVVQTTGKRPAVAHLLWLIVLAKLVTPPLVTIPVVAFPGLAASATEAVSDGSGLAAAAATLTEPVASRDETALSVFSGSLVEGWGTGLVLLWVVGSLCVLVWTLLRISKFNRLLRVAGREAPAAMQQVAGELAERLGLKEMPTILTTSASLAPMVWWVGGRVRVVIPAALVEDMDAAETRWILAHELAHVRRRDHQVRWLEWLVCVAFWWNPVAWWARRNLRINEELCCDALVLSALEPSRKTYASALVTVIESLAFPAIRPPAMASEIMSGGALERRLRTIVSAHPLPGTPRWLQACIVILSLGLLPLGIAYAEIGREGGGEAAGVSDETAARFRSQEIEGHFLRLGMNEERVVWMRGYLEGRGLRTEQTEQTLGGLLRVIPAMQSEGERFMLDPRLRDYFLREVRLSYAQLDEVLGLARRIIDEGLEEHAQDDGDSELDGHFRSLGVAGEMLASVRVALSERGLRDEQIEPTLGGMLRVVPAMQTEGANYVLDPRLRDYFQSQIRLTETQIDDVVGLARRIAHSTGGEVSDEPARR